ncbi:MAG: MotA/TolQ/ExbB proton channel family protein [Lachnospiraceae bacterium]|nr:MotA/TolQ/ExbB proton channel family protein [Lachnospiraceae bacterium]
MISENVNSILRAIVANLQTPVVIILLILMIATVVVAGTFVFEFFVEHRRLQADVPKLIETMNTTKVCDMSDLVNRNELLPRQKKVLKQLIQEQKMDSESREIYAAQLLFEEEEHYQNYLRWPQMISKLSPMFGLLGTLVPLGPGLMALGEGNTALLSQSLLIAFDTTSAGVLIAAVALVIAQIRRQWYRNYAQVLESLMEVILDKMKAEEQCLETGGAKC